MSDFKLDGNGTESHRHALCPLPSQNFTNDDGPRDVEFQAINAGALTFKIWLNDKDGGRWNGQEGYNWNCDGLEAWQTSVPRKTSDGDRTRCQHVRQGGFDWPGIYHVEATGIKNVSGSVNRFSCQWANRLYILLVLVFGGVNRVGFNLGS